MCTVQQPSKNVTYFEGASPILPVTDLEESLRYYVRTLGFRVNWQEKGFASVSRGRCSLMLCEGDQGHCGTWVWVGVGDVELLFQEYCEKRARIRHPPTNYSWAYEMQVSDLDGNVLRMGSDAKANQPIGPFLDMHGVLWTKSGDSWVRAAAPTSS
jgi:catechol 2,3-dioxygenase-like lactoylglutathione lyase family enzyme